MLSHDLRNLAHAMRLSADAPSADLRRAQLAFAEASERCANRACALEQLAKSLSGGSYKARLRRFRAFLTTLAMEAVR